VRIIVWGVAVVWLGSLLVNAKPAAPSVCVRVGVKYYSNTIAMLVRGVLSYCVEKCL
jgi:hypothetical protein